jgi:hypothetical protein
MADFVNAAPFDQAFKWSHMGSLFPMKKALFDKMPLATKGLQMSPPAIKLGGGSYTWSTTGNNDKIEVKGSDAVVSARFKKEKGGYDVTYTRAMFGMDMMHKFEKKNATAPGSYIVGTKHALQDGKVKVAMKMNACTQAFKVSAAFDTPVKGLTVATDVKGNVATVADDIANANVGLALEQSFGTVGVTANFAGKAYGHYFHKLDRVQFGAEACLAGATGKDVPVALAVAYNHASDCTIRAKLNAALQLQLGVNHTVTPGVTLQVGTLVDLNAPGMPNLGFKVNVKA